MQPEILLLIPTRFEADKLEAHLKLPEHVVMDVCGFGPIAAAASSSMLVQKHQPQHVLLLGIAGSIGDRLNVGSASSFSSVAIDGIGAGSGGSHVSAAEMGWRFLDFQGESIGESLPLVGDAKSGQLLTVCAAAGCDDDVRRRRERFPDAVAEDMEAFGVAMACKLADVPLTVVRGVSNVAGDRDIANWKIDAALENAAALAMQIFKEYR